MNARAAKLERRAIQRTLGQTGLQLVENHGEALEKKVMPSLGALTEIAKDADRRLSELETLRTMTFRQRCAWLLLGEWPDSRRSDVRV